MASGGTWLCPRRRACLTVLESRILCDLRAGQLHFWKMASRSVKPQPPHSLPSPSTPSAWPGLCSCSPRASKPPQGVGAAPCGSPFLPADVYKAGCLLPGCWPPSPGSRGAQGSAWKHCFRPHLHLSFPWTGSLHRGWAVRTHSGFLLKELKIIPVCLLRKDWVGM